MPARTAKAIGALNIPIDEVRRLAAPELGTTVRELWGTGPQNPDVRELLLEVIWQGPVKDCVEIALAAANDSSLETRHRIIAIRALIAAGESSRLRELADSFLASPTTWPNELVHVIAPELFPFVVSTAELIALMERTEEPASVTKGFGWTVRQITSSIEPWSQLGVDLRNRLAELIWSGRNPSQVWYQIEGRFDHIAPALALLLDRQLSSDPTKCDDATIRAAVIAHRFGLDEDGRRDDVGRLSNHFGAGSQLRETVFWAEIELMNELVPPEDAWRALYHAERKGLSGQLSVLDRPWLETAVGAIAPADRRPVALEGLLSVWIAEGCIPGGLDNVTALVRDDASLATTLAQRTQPPQRTPELERSRRIAAKRKCVDDAREAKRVREWTDWRDGLRANPSVAFEADNLERDVRNLHRWLRMVNRERSHYDVWSTAAVEQVFGSEIAARAAAAFQAMWRCQPPPTLWSQREHRDRNSMFEPWEVGLCGLSSEAMDPRWGERLSRDEARLASVYATLELDGFAPWVSDLASRYPSDVDDVLGVELSAQLDQVLVCDHLPALNDLAHADVALKRLLAPHLVARLTTMPTKFGEESAGRVAQHLAQIIEIVREIADEGQRTTVVQACESRLLADPSGPTAVPCLRGLLMLDPMRAMDAFDAALGANVASGKPGHILAALFDERRGSLPEFPDPRDRAFVLGRLVRSAYAHVRPADDRQHDEDSWTPDARDRAESARNFLLSALLDTSGAEAWRIVLELAVDPRFIHFGDRLRLLARERAALDAEFEPYTPGELVELEQRYEVPPHTRDGLFETMMDRISDLAHDVAHHDFTDRKTLRTIHEEPEMQRTLAMRLEAKAKGAYVVDREGEVADRKRTDIRFLARRGDQKAVIEIKLAEKWTLPELESALRVQLVGQYLRHGTCRAGCLLLTFNREKRHWRDKESGTQLTFGEVVELLAALAASIEAELAYTVRVGVFGIDLTDPPVPGQ